MADSEKVIAFQGELGANSHLACQETYSDMQVLPCHTFEDVFESVTKGRAYLAMIPIENSIAGRVADIHYLLPDSGLFIVGEHFQRVHHCLLAKTGTDINNIEKVYSHIQALSQCRKNLRALGIKPEPFTDTAGAAKQISEQEFSKTGAIASEFAAEIYGLDVVKRDIEDSGHNITRFVVLSKQSRRPLLSSGPAMTTFVFQVRNVPAALYKAMGGFATNGVNMTKLESYQLEGSFQATQFYADIEGHIEKKSVRLAIEELHFYTSVVNILGVYPAHDMRGLN